MQSVILAISVCLGWGTQAAELGQVEDFGPNPGNLDMYEYVPDLLPIHPALVVALHGCGQKAADYLIPTGWRTLADENHFVVILPQQAWSNNPMRCFKWWSSDSLTRGSGEPASIKSMIDKAAITHGIDLSRVYVTGLSAGGTMSLAMIALYPEVFAGGAPVAAVPFACADGVMMAGTCMMQGSDMTPGEWGGRVRAAATVHPGVYPGVHPGSGPKVSVWQGGSDGIVTPQNMNEIMEQWTDLHGIGQSPALVQTEGNLTRKIYQNKAGDGLVETNLIAEMPHGMAIDPKNGCGGTKPYIIDAGVCTVAHIAKFWGLR